MQAKPDHIFRGGQARGGKVFDGGIYPEQGEVFPAAGAADPAEEKGCKKPFRNLSERAECGTGEADYRL